MAKEEVEFIFHLKNGTAAKKRELAVRIFIAKAMKKRQHMHVIVGESHGSILYEYSIGIQKKWENDYDKIAKSPFKDTAATLRPTNSMRSECSQMEVNKAPYVGSWIKDGILIVVCGVQPYWSKRNSKKVVSVARTLVPYEQEELIT